MTSYSQWDIAVVAAFDLDLRRNFDPSIASRFGERPIIHVPNLHPQVANLTLRIGTSHSKSEVGVATALDFLFGLDGRLPIVGLIGGVFSSIALPVAALSSVLKTPHCAYAASSPALSNKQVYPYFLRTFPPDVVQGKAMWKWIVVFRVPLLMCIYGLEPYGQGLFQVVENEARTAGEQHRFRGVAMRNMEIFVVEEAMIAIDFVRSFKSRFLFLSTNVGLNDGLLPLLDREGFFDRGWQVVASETATNYANFPVGFMRWKPVSEGPKYQDFRELWSKMRATDVLSEEARARYGIDSFRIPLDEATVPPITDAGFVDPSLALDLYEPFLFDALYAFVIAINTLLNGGVPLEEIKGDRLLNQLRITEFEGISGLVSFDQYGDRQASYELVNLHPDGLRVAALYRGVEDQLVVAAGSVYWVGGMRVDQPPSFLTDCGPGSYKDELLGQCVPCTRGFQCINGTQELCPKGTFSNVSGATFCRNCSKGSFYGDLGSTRCTSCQAGFYADEEGLETCRRCPKGTYVSALHAESCFDCGMNQITEESGSQLQSDCRCAQGTFMCDTGPSLGCLTCPEGLLCATGLDPPVHQPGYWTSADDTCRFKVLKCRNARECPGKMSLGGCAAGREGRACNNCKPNHYPKDDGTCAECGATDFLPSVLFSLAALNLFILFVRLLQGDLDQMSLNTLTVAAVGGQMVTAVQALGSIRQLSIDWVEPVRSLISLTQVLVLDLDLVRISCVDGIDSPTVKFVRRLMLCPIGIGCILITWAVKKCLGQKMHFDTIFNICGVFTFALFISITLFVVDPLRCGRNPDGSLSMLSNPGVICFDSGEHFVMLFLCILGILCYPMTIISWATYTTCSYPSRITSGQGLQLVHRHRFLFQRFRPQRYYYGLLLLLRNAMLALFPVIFTPVPSLQIEIMGFVLLTASALQIRLWPWRTELANYTDLAINLLLQILLLGVSPLVSRDAEKSTVLLGYLLSFAVLSPFIAGLVVISHAIWRHFIPPSLFGVFLCHHKGSAGSLCRLLKLLAAKHTKSQIFLDSDQLEDLDLIFDTIRGKTKSVAVVLTPHVLKRMWCAGEIVTAYKNQVLTVPLMCDGYTPPDDEFLEHLEEVWTAQQRQILSFHGISMEDVQQAYAWLLQLECLDVHRFGAMDELENTVVELLARVKVPMKLFRQSPTASPHSVRVKARILITGSVRDGEALASLEIFQILAQKTMQRECAVVRSANELLAYRPWAYYLVVLLSRGMLRDPGFAKTLLSIHLEGETKNRPLELVTVSADPLFEFPSAEFFKDLEDFGLGLDNQGEAPLPVELGPFLSSAYRALLNVLALPLSPLGSEGLLEEQVSEICRRFRRYKNPIYATALDDEEDLKVEGDGVDPQSLIEENGSMGIFTDCTVKKQAFSRAKKSLTWTETGNMIESREGHMNDNILNQTNRQKRERLSTGSADSRESEWQVFQIVEELPSESWNPDVPSTLSSKRDLDSWNPDWQVNISLQCIREDQDDNLVEI